MHITYLKYVKVTLYLGLYNCDHCAPKYDDDDVLESWATWEPFRYQWQDEEIPLLKNIIYIWCFYYILGAFYYTADDLCRDKAERALYLSIMYTYISCLGVVNLNYYLTVVI